MDGINSATSALMAFSTQMSATANNIANSQTKGFQADRVNMVEQENGGVSAAVSKDEAQGTGLPSGPGQARGSNVDLAREMTEMVQTSQGYQANAKTISTLAETKGTLLDIVQ